MISVDSLLYKIDQRLNKLSSNEHQQIQLEDKILALNEAQIKLIEQKVSGLTSISGVGMDGFRKRYQDLQRLIVDYKPFKLELKNKQLNQWVAILPGGFMFYADSYILANKGRCLAHKIWVNQDLAKHGDVSLLLNNVHYRPSFEYQETFNTISSDEIAIYTDGTFTPTSIYLSYIRYPQEIDKTGYVKFNGDQSTDQDCELEAYLEDDLLDLTVQSLAMYTENKMAVETAQIRIQTNE